MNTVLRGSRTSFSLCVIGILACAPLLSVQAQTATSAPEITEATTSIQSAIPTVSPYKTERITGNSIQSGDYVVGPGKVEMVVRPGQSVTKIITVTNRISDGRQFELMVEDMSGSADGSQNVVLLGDVDGPYSLRDFISVPHETFMLGLGERAQIPVTVTMPPNAEPGGYYGAVLVSTVKVDDEEISGAPRSPIVARIGSLFFITVPGDINVGGEIKDVSTLNNKSWYNKGPIELGILFENTGSVHLNPHGSVRVRNMFGEEVGYVELEPWFVLPRSLRLREVTWDRELLFGRYSFEVEVKLGYEDRVDTRTIAVWVLPWKVLLGTFLVIAFVLWIIRFFFRTFEFKRRSS